MADIQKGMALISGKEPTPAQIQRLMSIAHAIGIPSDDPMFAWFVGLDSYYGLFTRLVQDVAEKNKEASKKALDDFKTSAKITANAVMHEERAELAKIVGDIAQQVAYDTSKAKKFRWTAICTIVSFLALSIAGGAAGWGGYQAGLAKGYQKAQDQKAAAAWANTQEGQIAYQLAQIGDLKIFSQCTGIGWIKKNGVCYAEPDGSDVQGWKIPTP